MTAMTTLRELTVLVSEKITLELDVAAVRRSAAG
jgi:hypothetical protein